MAMTSFQIWNGNAAGADTNGGGFDPSQTAGILLTVDPFKNLNGGLTSVNGVNLTVDSVNPLKVTPDGYTPWANDVGLKLLILPDTSWIAGVYTITGISGNSWILNYSPAVTSTTGGTWRMSDFRPNSLAGGGALLQGTAQLIPTQAG